MHKPIRYENADLMLRLDEQLRLHLLDKRTGTALAA